MKKSESYTLILNEGVQMNQKWTAILCILVMVFTVSCGGDKKDDTTEESIGTTSASGEIGVPECDEYVTKFKVCINSNVPDSVKATFEQSFDQAIQQWKEVAKTDTGKAGLAQGCKMAMDSAKQSMASFNCEW